MTKKSGFTGSSPQRGLGAARIARVLGNGKERRAGKGYLTCCPSHDDQNPSLSIADLDDGGVVVNCFAGCSIDDVVHAIEQGFSISILPPYEGSLGRSKSVAANKEEWVPLAPVPENAPAYSPPANVKAWRYCDVVGRTVMIVNRIDRRDGSKSIWPATYCENRYGRREWRRRAPKASRPPYQSDAIARQPSNRVLIVEGEKAADAAIALFPGFTVTTSFGGANAADKTDWSLLCGREVTIWPDNDVAGERYAKDVGQLLIDAGTVDIRIVRPPMDWPDGWDLADRLPEGVDEDELERILDGADVFVAQGHGKEFIATERGNRKCTDLAPDFPDWPGMPELAMRGLAGDFVEVATECSEADPMAVLATFLTYFGNAVGRDAHLWIGDTQHHSRLFCAVVGSSSRARKGTSSGPVSRLFEETGRQGGDTPIMVPGPLSSGEGLIYAIRDASEQKDDGGKPVDPGVEDKRLMVLDGELASALRVMKRDGNTLSTALRTAWDGGDLAPVTKTSRIRASKPHIGIVAHITRHELLKTLEEAEIWGGTGNRFLFVLARRQGLVAIPRPIDSASLGRLARRLAETVNTVRLFNTITLTDDAKRHWEALYPDVSRDHSGTFGTMTARAEAQVMRLALIYALLDKSTVIEKVHVEAGLAFWEYCRSSVAFIFDRKENPLEVKVLNALGGGPKSTTELHKALHGHANGQELQAALKDLVSRSVVDRAEEPTHGKAKTIWSLRDQN